MDFEFSLKYFISNPTAFNVLKYNKPFFDKILFKDLTNILGS